MMQQNLARTSTTVRYTAAVPLLLYHLISDGITTIHGYWNILLRFMSAVLRRYTSSIDVPVFVCLQKRGSRVDQQRALGVSEVIVAVTAVVGSHT